VTLINPLTTEGDLEALLAAIRRAAEPDREGEREELLGD
jgi:hypothetical protein